MVREPRFAATPDALTSSLAFWLNAATRIILQNPSLQHDLQSKRAENRKVRVIHHHSSQGYAPLAPSGFASGDDMTISFEDFQPHGQCSRIEPGTCQRVTQILGLAAAAPQVASNDREATLAKEVYLVQVYLRHLSRSLCYLQSLVPPRAN